MIPKGIYEIDEEKNEEKFTEDFTVPPTEELKSLETWGHRHPAILKAGRITHIVPNTVPEDERDAYLENL